MNHICGRLNKAVNSQFGEAGTSSVTQRALRNLRNMELHCPFPKGTSLLLILRQINVTQASPYYFFKVYFNSKELGMLTLSVEHNYICYYIIGVYNDTFRPYMWAIIRLLDLQLRLY